MDSLGKANAIALCRAYAAACEAGKGATDA